LEDFEVSLSQADVDAETDQQAFLQGKVSCNLKKLKFVFNFDAFPATGPVFIFLNFPFF
jgi:hypothetical protein